MIANLHHNCIIIDFIMLCDTFLSDLNQNMLPPGNQFVSNNRTRCKGGGVAMYIRDLFQYKIRVDFAMNISNKFESIFTEIDQNLH